MDTNRMIAELLGERDHPDRAIAGKISIKAINTGGSTSSQETPVFSGGTQEDWWQHEVNLLFRPIVSFGKSTSIIYFRAREPEPHGVVESRNH